MIKLSKSKGFTLVELSIVIVIISLIVAGVVAGQKIVEQAKLRSIITDFNKYAISTRVFVDSYRYFPGDMSNASSYWSGAGNGDGNGLVSNSVGSEQYLAWNHLARAELISGSFNGTSNRPTIFKSGKVAVYAFHGAGLYGNVPASTKNFISIQPDNGAIWTNNLGLSPIQASNIDKKMDDGVPHRGMVYALSSPTNACVKQSDVTTNAALSYTGEAQYNLAESSEICTFSYMVTK